MATVFEKPVGIPKVRGFDERPSCVSKQPPESDK
jgi:hypothetical protein